MPTDFLRVLQALEVAGVRYVLVGGLAVLLHGIDRLTADIDLVVDLAPEQARRRSTRCWGWGSRLTLRWILGSLPTQRCEDGGARNPVCKC